MRGGPLRCEAGQASIELVALLPVLAAVALILLQALAAGAARVYAGHAAEAGAVALVEGRDARGAAAAALPGWSTGAVRVRVQRDGVSVRVRPVTLVPGLADTLSSTVRSHIGRAG